MPSEHEPIDAHVKDGVVHVDPPPPRSPPAGGSGGARGGRPGSGQRGSFGCLVIPALVGLGALGLGIWQLTGWNSLPPAGRFGAIVLTGFGLFVTMLVGGAIWLLLKLRRLFTNLHRDAVTLVDQMKYMATMGRQGATGPRRAESATAEEATDGAAGGALPERTGEEEGEDRTRAAGEADADEFYEGRQDEGPGEGDDRDGGERDDGEEGDGPDAGGRWRRDSPRG